MGRDVAYDVHRGMQMTMEEVRKTQDRQKRFKKEAKNAPQILDGVCTIYG